MCYSVFVVTSLYPYSTLSIDLGQIITYKVFCGKEVEAFFTKPIFRHNDDRSPVSLCAIYVTIFTSWHLAIL